MERSKPMRVRFAETGVAGLVPPDGAPAGPRPLSTHLASAGIFVAATAVAFMVQDGGRPVTTAFVYLFAVTSIAALEGLRGGLAAAIAASFIYNFFMIDPRFQITLSHAEEYVPLIAFNFSAVASGLIAGRLRDRVHVAERVQLRIQSLLDLAQRLQRAIEVKDVAAAVRDVDAGKPKALLYVSRNGQLAAAAGETEGLELALEVWNTGVERTDAQGCRANLLVGRSGAIGVLLTPALDDERGAGDIAFANLVAIATDRCLLLESLAEAELVRRSEAFKTALLASVSHDMRTPLSAIAASASSLASFGAELHADVRADLVQMIEVQCRRLDRYTTNLLSCGRIQAGIDASQFAPCDALDVLGVAIASLRSQSSDRPIVKDFQASQVLVRADPVMLEQVFHNILENAARYSPENAPIRVEVRCTADWLAIEIVDFGAGIPREEAERVFDRFYRSPSVQGRTGTGLGLPIARGFTEAFGGQIEILQGSEGSGGTRIRIHLPRLEAEAMPNE
jgi:two-component system sensor histidine kinase KdpD